MTVVILTFYKAVEVYLDDSIQTFLKENKILLTTLHADSVFLWEYTNQRGFGEVICICKPMQSI